jgi:hypothetical protein
VAHATKFHGYVKSGGHMVTYDEVKPSYRQKNNVPIGVEVGMGGNLVSIILPERIDEQVPLDLNEVDSQKASVRGEYGCCEYVSLPPERSSTAFWPNRLILIIIILPRPVSTNRTILDV